MDGTGVNVGSSNVGVSEGMALALVEVGEGAWLVEVNIGKLQANIRLTIAMNPRILKIRMTLSF
jgi:hypothetical protein